MKLHEVRKKYGFNQTIFYRWMIEGRLIEETDKGYAVGPNALEGMRTLATSYSNDAGQTIDRTQVMIEEAQIPELIQQYENSGKEDLYAKEAESDKKEKTVSELTSELEWTDKRINMLESQVRLLKSQVKLLMNHFRTE